MPTINVQKNCIINTLRKEFTDEEFGDILFDFGLELDEVYEEDGVTKYKIEVPANRYDLLCAEGLCTALKSYIFEVWFSDFELIEEFGKFIVYKDEIVERNFIACAVIEDIDFTESKYQSFISYQEKLADNLGRNRTIVAIGTHDMGKFKFPVTYTALNKENVDFVPLRFSQSVNGLNLREAFEGDNKISKCFEIEAPHNKYIVYQDCDGNILSVPPIINSEKSKISLKTRNVFIEVTGTNFYKVNVTLKHILSCFKGEKMYKCTIIPKDQMNSNNTQGDSKVFNDTFKNMENNLSLIRQIKKQDTPMLTPVLHTKTYTITTDEVFKELRIEINVYQITRLLMKMMYKVEILDEKTIKVIVPNARSDIIHKVDVLEDLAIAYGFNNIERKLPYISTIGTEDKINKISDKLRIECAMLGFIEVHTLVLLSKNDNIIDNSNQACINNFKSLECEVLRTSLLPGLYKSVSSNLHSKIPIKIFEVSDIVQCDDSDIGASNIRMLSCMCISNTSCLDEIQGPLCHILEKCGISRYEFVNKDYEDRYLKNQSAALVINGKEYGSIGVCKPELLNYFKIPYSGSCFEINIQSIIDDFLLK